MKNEKNEKNEKKITFELISTTKHYAVIYNTDRYNLSYHYVKNLNCKSFEIEEYNTERNITDTDVGKLIIKEFSKM